MLEQLLIRNFQCHETRRIEFDPHVTCIVGESRAGKSAALRALRWVCLNKPTGEEFIRHGEEEAKVSLYADGYKITRKKGKENSYSLDGSKLKAFGTGVPTDIASLLSIDEENFQRQLEHPYWFFKTPGEVSKELNRIVNLDLIDRTLSHIAAKQRTNRSELDFTQKRLAEATEQLDSMSWVADADARLREIECTEEHIGFIRTTIDSLAFLLEERENSRLRLQNAADARTDALSLMETIDEVERLREQRDSMQELLSEREALCENLISLEERTRVAESDLKEALKSTCPTCGQPLTGS